MLHLPVAAIATSPASTGWLPPFRQMTTDIDVLILQLTTQDRDHASDDYQHPTDYSGPVRYQRCSQ